MKNVKRILCICLIVCICLCAVGCNKVNDNNSSGFSSTVTQTEISSIDSEIESTEENTSTDESKVSKEGETDTAESKTNKEEIKVSREEKTDTVENNVIEWETAVDTYTYTYTNYAESEETKPMTWEIYKKIYLPDWASEYPASEIVDWNYFDEGSLLIITKEKELYQLSKEKLFSNGTHFKKIDSELKFEKFLFASGRAIITTDNKLFLISSNGELNSLDENSKNTVDKQIVGSYKDNAFLSGNHTLNSSYVRYRNNSILSFENEILYSFPQDENIISINSQNIVQTTKGFYKISCSTEKEFADSEPKTVIKAEFISTQLEEMFIKRYLFMTW